ncbi:MAG TPA: VWA domain-containing protein [Vicinamibacterales bacterium]|nr:VWA domain-containing protein [Vicinamibacterales bacterium]
MPARRRSLTTLLCATLLVAAWGEARGHAQDPQKPADPPQQPTFRAKVNLVRVDVSVSDRDGKAIEGLQPSDFIVKEDGVIQAVESAQLVRLNGTPPGDLKESIEIRSPEHARVQAARDDVRLFVLFLDDYHVDKAPQVMIPLRRTLKAFIEKLGPFDLVAIVDPLTPLSHIEFSRNRNEMLERVAKFEGRRGELFPVRSAAEEAQQTQRNVWELRAGVTLDAVNAVATHLGGLREGRKSILFVSQGPPVSLRSVNWPRMEEVVESANRGNVTIHTLDPRMLGSSEFGGNLVLRRFSDETGGRAIFNTNDHSEHLDGVFDDASAYYLVGYAPTREMADGKFHKIDVEVKRKGVRVVARRGYYAPRAAELTAPLVTPVASEVVVALTNLVEPKSGRTADVWIGFARGATGGTVVTAAWEPTTRMGANAATRIAIEHLNHDGSVDGKAQSIVRREAATAPAVARFSLGAGKTILRFTSYDAADEVLDRWTEDVTVPPFAADALALATPRFLLARSAFELRALQSANEITPAASRRLRKTDRVLVELEYYSPSGAPELVVELLNQKGVSLVTLPVPAAEGNTARVEVPLSSLAPAVYVLRVRARTADKQVEQHVPFRIVP